jgi:thioredoxin reductase (NADPH)
MGSRGLGSAGVTVEESVALTETPDVLGAYPSLTDAQLAVLEGVGQHRRVDAGTVLFREGDGSEDFFVILEGKVAVLEETGAGQRVIGIHGPRRFLGELGLLTGQAAFVTAVLR